MKTKHHRHHNKSKGRQTRKQRRTSYNNDYYTANNPQIQNSVSQNNNNREKNAFTEARDVMQKKLLRIIQSQPKASDIRKIYDSFVHPVDIEQKRKAHLYETLYHMEQQEDISSLIHWLNHNGFTSPLSFVRRIDPKNNKYFITEVTSDGITFTMPAFYKDPANKKRYTRFLKQFFDMFEIEEHTEDELSAIYDIEHTLLKNSMTPEEYMDPLKNYHKLSLSQVKREFGLTLKTRNSHVLVQDPDYVKKLMRLFLTKDQTKSETWRSPEWKLYWKYQIFRLYSQFYPDIIRMKEAFFRHYFPVKKMTNEKQALHAVLWMKNKEINSLYESHVDRTKERRFCFELIEKIKRVMRETFESNTWLQPSTRAKALKKLDHMTILIGASNKSAFNAPTRREIQFDATDPIHNVLSFAAWFADITEKHVKAPSDHIWDLEPDGLNFFDVNAYYMVTRNQILLPDGLLSPPFLDLRKPFAYNMAHIGTILAHEMSHAFDSQGYLYDEHGRLDPWWTPHDEKAYRSKMEEVKKQYIDAAKRDHFKARVGLSIGENLADIVGFQLAEQVLLSENPPPSKEVLHAFYKQYAKIWHTSANIRNVKKKMGFGMDAHSFSKYRVNCVLARSPHFRSLYGIKPGDGMYWEGAQGIW